MCGSGKGGVGVNSRGRILLHIQYVLTYFPDSTVKCGESDIGIKKILHKSQTKLLWSI